MADPVGKYARHEDERRWLLPALPAALDASRPWARITDHYIDGTRFRVRQRLALADGDVVYKLTHKFPEYEGAHDRVVITNNYLTREEYARFRRLPGRALVKDRWTLERADARYAIDVYAEALDGLITAERDYASHEALLASGPPPFDGAEVTERAEFTGGALAGQSFADIREIVRSLLAR